MDINQYLKEQKEIIQNIRQKFFKAQNLYEKHFWMLKIQCYNKYQDNILLYYQCLEELEIKIKKNADLVESRINQIEMKDKECINECKLFFKDDSDLSKINKCFQKCSENKKQQAISFYTNFYKENIEENSEFKKTKL